MAGTRIIMNAETLNQYAQQLLSVKKEMETSYDSLDKAVTEVLTNSEGESVIAFQERYLQVQTMYENMIELLQQYSDALIKIKEQYQEVDAMNAAQIRSL
ncbi:MAG: WXG100 family type VII secretion target [Lachnospiraceae bacterium]|nr:WXG100 family type VII secretion target [Lachnospiraceae bacterium]